MAISRNLATGKSRKSAGDFTYYTRLGVACFRQKPARSPGYKSSVPQRMQQSVFRFMKQNVDASGVKSFIDTFYDAKPRKGKSETKMNMFYRSFMPHMVAEKAAIYGLAEEAMINPSLFLGQPSSNRDRLSNGALGTLILGESTLESMTIAEDFLNQILDKANKLISVSATPYTADDVFVGVFGANPTSQTGYQLVAPTNVKPTLANGVYTFDLSALTSGMSDSTNVYVALMIAGVDTSGGVDIMRRKFATDSAVLNGVSTRMVRTSPISVSKVGDKEISMVLPKSAFDTAGIEPVAIKGSKCTESSEYLSTATITNVTVAGDNVTCAVAVEGPNPTDNVSTVALDDEPKLFRRTGDGADLDLIKSFYIDWSI